MCDPISLAAIVSAGTGVGSLVSGRRAAAERKKATALAQRQAEEAKTAGDTRARASRADNYETTAQTAAATPGALPRGLFSARSFFSARG